MKKWALVGFLAVLLSVLGMFATVNAAPEFVDIVSRLKPAEFAWIMFFLGVFVLSVLIAFVSLRASNPENRAPKSQESQLQGDPAAQPESSRHRTWSRFKDLLKALLLGLAITYGLLLVSPILIILLHILIGSH